MNNNTEFQELIEYDDTSTYLSLQKWPHQENLTTEETCDSVTEALSLLDGWCEPLAVAISYRPQYGQAGNRVKPRSSILFANDLPADSKHLVRTWPMWADPLFPSTITPDTIANEIRQRLEAKKDANDGLMVESLQFFCNRYRVFPPHDTSDVLVTIQGSDTQIPVPTEAIDSQLWVYDPPMDSPLFQIAYIYMSVSESMNSFHADISLAWSNHGADASPGWNHLLDNANRLNRRQ